MIFKKNMKVLGISATTILLALSLSGCGDSFKSLPDEQRYQRIDKVLTDIDYKNIGDFVTEARDNGDGVFAPSHKSVSYKNSEVYEKILMKLEYPEDKSIITDCKYYEDTTQLNCTYYGAQVSIGRSNTSTSMTIADSQNGRGMN